MPGASDAMPSITSRSTEAPVGLFGEQTNTTSGWNTRTCALACDRVNSKFIRRAPSQLVPVFAATI